MAGTTIPAYGGDQLARRIIELFPSNWAGDDARSEGGNVYAMMRAVGDRMQFLLQNIQYDLAATRLQTATAPELDLASQDFFGSGLPRPVGMSDGAFAQLIIANLFLEAATRPALQKALLGLTGQLPRMLEPWSVLDTGWWGDRSYWSVDTIDNPARWGSPGLRYQGFIETVPPAVAAIGPQNPILTWGTAYWNVPGYFFGIISTTPLSAVYNLINRLKAEGTLVWVKLVSNSSGGSPQPGGGTTGTPPSPVTNFAVAVNASTATLSWTAPASGDPPYAYTAFYRVQGASTWQAGPTVGNSPAQITNLQANLGYEFEVIVRNKYGQAVTDPVQATTLKVPPSPAQNLRVTTIGSTALTLAWDPPASGTPPFIMNAQYRIQGAVDWIPFGTAGNYTTITITNLKPSTTYELEVVTSNA